MINKGVEHAQRLCSDYDVMIVSSGDVRIKSKEYLRDIVNMISDKDYDVITSIWFFSGLSTEFCVLSPIAVNKIFSFSNNILNSSLGRSILNMVNPLPIVEFIFMISVISKNNLKLGLLPKRGLVHWINCFKTKGLYDSTHYD